MSVRLAAGDLRLELRPEVGGSVAAFRLDRGAGFALMRSLAGTPPDAVNAAMFPMLPFANCIRDNRFNLDGRTYELQSNMPGVRLNFHGSGWQSPWQVTSQGASQAAVEIADGRVGDVYRYSARQQFELDVNGFTVETSVTNRADRRMPFSFGQHPWFPTHGEALVRFRAAALWRSDAEGQTEQLVPVTPPADYSVPRPPPDSFANTCYTGWDGRAEIEWPSAGVGLSIRADPVFSHLMLHVPADGQPVFCLEPQSNAPCAFDGLGDGRVAPGVFILEPGASVAGGMRFEVAA
jgi:aldose 1-epimerase